MDTDSILDRRTICSTETELIYISYAMKRYNLFSTAAVMRSCFIARVNLSTTVLTYS